MLRTIGSRFGAGGASSHSYVEKARVLGGGVGRGGEISTGAAALGQQPGLELCQELAGRGHVGSFLRGLAGHAGRLWSGTFTPSFSIPMSTSLNTHSLTGITVKKQEQSRETRTHDANPSDRRGPSRLSRSSTVSNWVSWRAWVIVTTAPVFLALFAAGHCCADDGEPVCRDSRVPGAAGAILRRLILVPLGIWAQAQARGAGRHLSDPNSRRSRGITRICAAWSISCSSPPWSTWRSQPGQLQRG